MTDPIATLCNELRLLGHYVPHNSLVEALKNCDQQLVQGQRPAVKDHLAQHSQLSKEFFTEKEGNG